MNEVNSEFPLFQRLMGSAENKEGLISFLNAVLSKTRKEKIEDVEIIENKQLAKKLILDKTGRWFCCKKMIPC